MLGKIILTAIIIFIAVSVLRHRRQAERLEMSQSSAPSSSAAVNSPPSKNELNDYRFAAYLFLILMLGTGSYLYYLRWQNDNDVITVILHREGASAPVTYQVLRKDMDERSFTTVDGTRVTVASSERMEVTGL